MAALDKAISDRNELERRQMAISVAADKIRADIRTLLQDWDAGRVDRLTYLDFLYFSMGVATSNTFGDMIPNDRAIRFIIIVQIIFCLIVLGLFINSLSLVPQVLKPVQ